MIKNCEPREINAAEEAGFRFASECLRAERTALRLIARAEQSVSGLTYKLERRGHGTACVNAAVSRLVELKLLDDRRFAQLWLESRLRLTRSPRRLLSSLAGRGIDREDAQTALKAVLDEETEFALLKRFAEKRLRNIDRSSLKRVLKAEGFSFSAIAQFLETAGI
jgi:regulatory protein